MTRRIMSSYPQERFEGKAEASREQFADGSALVTYRDGGMLILESALAKSALLGEVRPVNYNEPAPAPGGSGKL